MSSAQVQLVLPNPQAQLFSDNVQPSTAAVLLSGSTSLDPGAVKGIAQLVASSVPNLHADKVTITDASGQLLWPTADSVGAGGTSLLAKQSAQAQYDSSMEAQVNAMLTQTLGAGKAQVQVNADLDANQANADALTYKGKGIPLVQHTQTESLKGAGGAAGAGRHRGEHPRVRADRRRQLELQQQGHRQHDGGQQDRHSHCGRARQQSIARPSRCWSTRRCLRPRSLRSRPR